MLLPEISFPPGIFAYRIFAQYKRAHEIKKCARSFFEHRKDGYMNSTEKENVNLSGGAAETVKSKKEIRAEKRAARKKE